MKAISIITICFNDFLGLKKTFFSIENQKYKNFEWIVIDGGSEDGSLEFLKENSLVSAYVSEKDEGIYDAMKKGLCLSKGEFVLFLNSGDILDSNDSLLKAVSYISGNDVCFFSTHMVGRKSWIRRARDISYARYSVPAVQQSTIYRTDVLKGLDWPIGFKICGDYAIAAQLLKNGVRSISVDFVLSKFFLGGVSTSRFVLLAQEAAHIQNKYLKIGIIELVFGFSRRCLIGGIVWFQEMLVCRK